MVLLNSNYCNFVISIIVSRLTIGSLSIEGFIKIMRAAGRNFSVIRSARVRQTFITVSVFLTSLIAATSLRQFDAPLSRDHYKLGGETHLPLALTYVYLRLRCMRSACCTSACT